MDKKLKLESELGSRLQDLKRQIPPKFYPFVEQFIDCYRQSMGVSFTHSIPTLLLFIQLIEKELAHPHIFAPYAPKVRSPIDYYQFSLDFVGPLIDLPHSTLHGKETLAQIAAQLKRRENAVLLANHQTEADPQAIAVMLREHDYPTIAEKMIYVAGERVTTDPLAIPFSMGCDLLCIYSKRYIDHPAELKAQKQLHNKNTMERMRRLLEEGGKIIYVAPSGGRDRKNSSGVIEVAPLDPSSIELFYLMAKKAKTPTHFYPLTLATYDLLPPPETVQKELGEQRFAKRSPVHLAFAPEFDMEKFPHSDHNDKTERRQGRADALWEIIHKNYLRITQ